MSKRALIEAAASALTQKLMDDGKLIEAGFAAFARAVIPNDAPAIQRSEMRIAFVAGAEHVFSSIMNVLEEGEDPTANDLRRLEMLQNEIDELRAELTERFNPTKGHA